MSEIVFYTNPMSRGRIARWMLEETGVPYHTEIVPFGQPMKTEAYCSINPMGKVPSIVHRQKVVTECAAICAYLADAFPQAGLAPPTMDRADYYRWMFFAAGPLEAAVSNRALGFVVPEDRRRMIGYGSYDDVMATLEKAVGSSAYIAGERFTAADVYVGSHIGWGLQFGSIEKRPAFVEYLGRLSQRQAYQRAVELDNSAMATLQKTA